MRVGQRGALLFGSLVLAVAVVAGAGIFAARTADGGAEVVRLDADPSPGDVGITPNADLEGARLPDASLSDVDGASVRLSDLVGTPLVVNFWYSTCPPCRQELPAFAQVAAERGDSVRFVGINPLDAPDNARSFAAYHGMTYRNLLDPDGKVLSAIGITVFPTTLLVRADGSVASQHAGAMTADDLRSAIDRELVDG